MNNVCRHFRTRWRDKSSGVYFRTDVKTAGDGLLDNATTFYPFMSSSSSSSTRVDQVIPDGNFIFFFFSRKNWRQFHLLHSFSSGRRRGGDRGLTFFYYVRVPLRLRAFVSSYWTLIYWREKLILLLPTPFRKFEFQTKHRNILYL